MYILILLELSCCKDTKELYYTFNRLKKEYNLNLSQCRYILNEYNNN